MAEETTASAWVRVTLPDHPIVELMIELEPDIPVTAEMCANLARQCFHIATQIAERD